MRTAIPSFLTAIYLTTALHAQVQPPRDAILAHFGVREAQVQSLTLPKHVGLGFGVSVRLGKTVHTFALEPFDVRGARPKVLIDDGRSLRAVPPVPVHTVRGTVRGVVGTTVAASLENGQLSGAAHLANATWWIEPLSAMTGKPSALHVIFRNDALVDRGHRCGTGAAPVDTTVAPASAGECLRVADIAIDADFAFYSRYGKSTNTVQTRVNGIMNLVDAIYQRDVKVALRVSTLIIRTQKLYTGTTNSAVLSEFANHWRTNHTKIDRDLAHRFTSVSTGNIVGTAYVSVVCGASAYAFSRASYGSVATSAGLVAHEIGHNFGSGHCNSNRPCYIMCSTLGSCDRSLAKFGAFAIQAINTFKSGITCLGTPTATAAPVLSAVSPKTVVAFPQQKITVTGTEMFALESVTIGGKAARFDCVDDKTVSATVPKGLVLGLNQVQLKNSLGTSNALNLDVTGAHPSVTDVPFLMLRNQNADLIVHTEKGFNAMLLISTSVKPSVLPGYFSLKIGNAFSELVMVAVMQGDATGQAKLSITVPGSVPLNASAYWQAMTWDPSKPASYPLETSNVAVSIVQK